MLAVPYRSRHTGTQRLVSQGTGFLPPDLTFGSIHQLPNISIGVQFELANFSTDENAVYNACYALSAGVSDRITPLNADGERDDTLWVPITRAGSPRMTVPPAAGVSQFGRLVTDFMPFLRPPPARIEGGSGICLMYRQYCVSGVHTVGNFDMTYANWNGSVNGQDPAQFGLSFGGGWMARYNGCLPGSFSVPDGWATPIQCFAPHAIMPTTTAPVLTVMSVGDSILTASASREGARLFQGANGIGMLLARAWDRPDRPALHRNCAQSGQPNAEYVADASLALAVSVPDVMLIQPYSPNGDSIAAVTSRDSVWTQFQTTLSFVAHAAALGVRTILVNAPPFAGPPSARTEPEWEVARVYANSLLKGIGVPVLDLDVLLGFGTNPASYRPEMSYDGIHPNEAASRLAADAAAGLFRHVYGIT